MKKLLGIALTLALLFSLAAFAAAAPSEAGLKILVASDIHYRPFSALPPLHEANTLPGDPIFHHANTKGMLTYEADAILDAFFKRAEQSGARYLLIPGDMSEEGHWAEHRGIAKKLREFQKRSGIKVFVLPGNHDIRTSASQGRLDLADFLDVYAQLGYDKALTRFEGDASYTAELDRSYRLLAIDACVYREDESAVSPELFAWIEAQVLQAQRDGKQLIAMTHYNVLDHFAIEGLTAGLLTIDQYRTLATALADWGVKYVFTGHGHANDIAYAVTRRGNKIFDIETGSLITYPNAWREVAFSNAAVKIETKYVDKIDTSLLPAGFSKAQIQRMKDDFPAYSLAYFRAGFRAYAGMLSDLSDSVPEAVVKVLQNAVNRPFDDEYANILDMAGALYAGHYAGNEANAEGLRLLGRAVINAIPPAALVPGPGRVVTGELVRTLAAGIFTDWSGVDDLNATLEPYGASWGVHGRGVKITDAAFYLDILWRVFGAVVNMVFRIARFDW